ncbi:MAG: PilZ domain-containing protein [Planctomycetes bacterium]|nr:PilZ domain-containing protein [Planctomycetota bacterium]
MTDEKRRAARITFKGLVHCEQVDVSRLSHNETMGRTLDISEGGILLEAQQHFPLLSQIDFGVALGDEIIDAKGKVIHLSQKEDGKIHMGIQFVEMSEPDKEKLREYCRKKQDGEEKSNQ